MGRTLLAAGAMALLAASLAEAGEYVPGTTRADGLYLPPHFRGTAQMVQAAEAWFDDLARSGAATAADKLPPGAAGSPPAPLASVEQRR